MATRNAEALAAVSKKYEWGFSSDLEQEFAPKGLSEDTVRFISAKKGEPVWMLDWRLKAYRMWLEMETPDWRSEEHTSELQSLMRISYAVCCLTKKKHTKQ